jgi:hypothetical protein
MSKRALDRGHRHILRSGIGASKLQQARYGSSFRSIASGSGRGVRVDMIDIHIREASVMQRVKHGSVATATFVITGSNVHSVTRCAVAPDLAYYVGIPQHGMLRIFQNQGSSTFTHNKAITRLIERPAGI